MESRPLGATGLQVSTVSFGTGSLGELFGPLDEGAALRLVDEVVASGITFIDTAPYYGSAEERLGKALSPSKRANVLLGTKAGRYGFDDFDFSPKRIRESLERSLRLLRTDYVDVFQLHDIEFAALDSVLSDSLDELRTLRDEGKCRFIGMTGYPLKTFGRVLNEADIDVVLTYAKGTLLDDSLNDYLAPIADQNGVGLMNAAAVSLGLLTPHGPSIANGHPATPAIREAANAMTELARQKGIDIASLANQYAIQCTRAATTVVGAGKSRHLQAAIEAATAPVDTTLLEEFLALRPAPHQRQWTSGRSENN